MTKHVQTGVIAKHETWSKHDQCCFGNVWNLNMFKHVQVLNIAKTWSVFKHVQTCFEQNQTWFVHVWPESNIPSMLDHVQNMFKNFARTCSVHVVQYIVFHHRTGYWRGTWIGTLCIPILSIYTNRPVISKLSCSIYKNNAMHFFLLKIIKFSVRKKIRKVCWRSNTRWQNGCHFADIKTNSKKTIFMHWIHLPWNLFPPRAPYTKLD